MGRKGDLGGSRRFSVQRVEGLEFRGLRGLELRVMGRFRVQRAEKVESSRF